MLNSRIFLIFSQLNAKERRAFKKFVQSPFHNAREDTRILYEYILKNHRQPKLLDREALYKKLYPGELYNDAKMRQVMTHLRRLFEQYLAVNALMEDPIKMNILAARAFQEKKLKDTFRHNLTKAEELLEKQEYRSRSYYESAFMIQSEWYDSQTEEVRSSSFDLEPLRFTQEVRFILEKLHLSCSAITHQNVFKSEYSPGLTAAVITYIEKENLLDIPAVNIYYYAYQTLIKEEDQWFFNLKTQLTKHGFLFPPTELRSLFLIALNYCIKKINKGFPNFIQESYTLYKSGMAFELFVINGELSRFTYKNIVAIGLKLKDYEWIEQFIHDYKNFLSEKYRDSQFNYSLSKLYFAKKDYHQAMGLLVKVEYDDVFLNLDSKTMLMKIYYELDEWDALESLLSSFTIFIRRKKELGYQKATYKNIIKLTRKLTTFGPSTNFKYLKLKEQIEQSNPNTEKEWLLEQLEKLKN